MRSDSHVSEFTYFNSIKVRLELEYNPARCKHLKLFQFHKGTIRTGNKIVLSGFDQYFNSIKVRLEHHRFSNAPTARSFQFHKGTIRTGGAGMDQRWNHISIP